MIIIQENTEEHLLNELKTAKQRNSTHRCVHFDFSKAEGLDLIAACRTIEEFIGDPKGTILISEDKNIWGCPR